jgi:hypothetical protein
MKKKLFILVFVTVIILLGTRNVSAEKIKLNFITVAQEELSELKINRSVESWKYING